MCNKPKCDISKCHASCCYSAPMPKGYFSAFKRKVITPWKRLVEHGIGNNGEKLYVAVVDEDFHKNKYPFLRDDYKCNIYDKRPWICKAFGTPPKGCNSKFLQCGWLNGLEYDNMATPEGIEDDLMGIMELILKGEIKFK